MSGLFGLLDIGRSALLSQQLGARVTSHNVANVNTEGFTRRRLVLAPADPVEIRGNLIGSGVKTEAIRSDRDRLIEKQVLDDRSDLGRDSTRATLLPYLESVLSPEGGGGIEDGLNEFFQAWHDLAGSPQSTAARSQVLTAGKTLSARIRRARSDLVDQRRAIYDQAASLAGEINDLTARIARLNPEVRKARLATGDAGDIRDERNRLLSELADRIEIKVFEDENGVVEVYTSGGRSLVTQDHAAVLSISPSGTDANGIKVELAMGSGQSHDITDSLGGGKIQGLVSSSQDIADYIDSLDQFALDLINDVNTVHSAGYGLDGNTGRNFFQPTSDPTDPEGAAAVIALSSDVDKIPDNVAAAQDPASLPGDNRNALAMTDLQDGRVDAWSNIVADVGLLVASAQTDEAFHKSALDQTLAFRESVSGVSLEEEMVNMIKYQQAFAAAAKVVQTADELFDSLLAMKR